MSIAEILSSIYESIQNLKTKEIDNPTKLAIQGLIQELEQLLQ